MRFKQFLHNLTELFYAVKEKNIVWQIQNIENYSHIKQAKSLAKQQLEHELSLLKIKQNNELKLLKTRFKADLTDYEDQLASLSQLKLRLQASYPNLPETISNTIYHHAKALLNAMWDATDSDDRLKCEAQLVSFLTTLHEESFVNTNSAHADVIPHKTLCAIKGKDVVLPAIPVK